MMPWAKEIKGMFAAPPPNRKRDPTQASEGERRYLEQKMSNTKEEERRRERRASRVDLREGKIEDSDRPQREMRRKRSSLPAKTDPRPENPPQNPYPAPFSDFNDTREMGHTRVLSLQRMRSEAEMGGGARTAMTQDPRRAISVTPEQQANKKVHKVRKWDAAESSDMNGGLRHNQPADFRHYMPPILQEPDCEHSADETEERKRALEVENNNIRRELKKAQQLAKDLELEHAHERETMVQDLVVRHTKDMAEMEKKLHMMVGDTNEQMRTREEEMSEMKKALNDRRKRDLIVKAQEFEKMKADLLSAHRAEKSKMEEDLREEVGRMRNNMASLETEKNDMLRRLHGEMENTRRIHEAEMARTIAQFEEEKSAMAAAAGSTQSKQLNDLESKLKRSEMAKMEMAARLREDVKVTRLEMERLSMEHARELQAVKNEKNEIEAKLKHELQTTRQTMMKEREKMAARHSQEMKKQEAEKDQSQERLKRDLEATSKDVDAIVSQLKSKHENDLARLGERAARDLAIQRDGIEASIRALRVTQREDMDITIRELETRHRKELERSIAGLRDSEARLKQDLAGHSKQTREALNRLQSQHNDQLEMINIKWNEEKQTLRDEIGQYAEEIKRLRGTAASRPTSIV